jgi:hypothetical protein
MRRRRNTPLCQRQWLIREARHTQPKGHDVAEGHDVYAQLTTALVSRCLAVGSNPHAEGWLDTVIGNARNVRMAFVIRGALARHRAELGRCASAHVPSAQPARLTLPERQNGPGAR